MKIRLLYVGNLLGNKGYTPTTIDTLSESFKASGYEVHAVSSSISIYKRFLEMVWAVLKRRNQTDYVLIDTYSTLNFYYAYVIAMLCRLFKLKYIPILHGGALPERLSRNPRLCKQLFKNAYQNVAPSMYLYTAFKTFGLNNLVFIPNSIELNQYPIVTKTYQTPKLLWVRSLASIYNPMMALEVLKKVLEVYPNTSLTMVGPDKDGSLKEVTDVASSQSLPVICTGQLSKKAWIELSKSHHIFINTTNFDNTPVSVMEAMALGFPVVSTNVGGIPFLIEDGKDGLLVSAGDVASMSAQVLALLQDATLREQIIAHAVAKTRQWDWEIVKRSWAELLQK